jgi:hypothetical protein
MGGKMKTKWIAVIVIVIVAVAVSALFLVRGLGPRRFFGDKFLRGNITLDENKINEVSDVFENAETSGNITEYCNSHRIECGYYCRNVNPEHEYCNNLSYLRNREGV